MMNQAISTAHDDPILAALQARLATLESELARLTNLASTAKDPAQQNNHWDLARQLQRDARGIRAAIQSRTQAAD